MSWRTEWQTASFRGVEFRFRSASAALGRRNVVHQYPGRDDPYVEDLGRKAREYTFEAFVIGDNYMAWRDRLEAACEQAGNGELVHPTRGRMLVAVQDCRPAESIEQRGLASYSLTFIESGPNLNPTLRTDTRALVDVAGDKAVVVAQQDFSDVFSVAGQPDFVSLGAEKTLQGALSSVLDVRNRLTPKMNLLPDINGAAQNILRKLSVDKFNPATLADKYFKQIAGLRLLGSTPLSSFNGLRALFDFGASAQEVPRTTPARIQQADNDIAVQTMVRRAALIEAAKTSARIDYPSRNEAIATRDVLAERLEAEAESAPDDVYVALTDLRVAVVKDIATRSADMTQLVSYTPRATQPAIVLAYQLYEDPERADEIVSRNRVRHPGFVPGGRDLEVPLT